MGRIVVIYARPLRKDEEIIALAKAASPYGGSYISHMRSEGPAAESLTKCCESREGGVAAEIYHLKRRAGQLGKATGVRSDSHARREGRSCRQYNYPAGATEWTPRCRMVQEGGYRGAKRTRTAIRGARCRRMRKPTTSGKIIHAVGSPDKSPDRLQERFAQAAPGKHSRGCSERQVTEEPAWISSSRACKPASHRLLPDV